MKEIPLTRGYVALVDDEDYERLAVHKWSTLVLGKRIKRRVAVRVVRENGKQRMILMHREIVNAPKGRDVDHEDGDGLHNWRGNLRVCTRAENSRNQRVRPYQKSSRFKGVCWDKWHERWLSCITVDARQLHLGRFDDEAEAARAYDTAAIQHFGEFARPNFPILPAVQAA